MLLLVPLVLAAAADAQPSPALMRQIVAETAVAQVEAIDPRWHPAQRDCAGLVRFAYRAAFARLAPERLTSGPWRDRDGRATPFADAETLLLHNFAFVGRQPRAPRELESGDLVAFRQQRGPTAAPVYHLMLIVRPADPAHDDAYVVYHPGEPGAAVRFGSLPSLVREAPHEWRPVPENPSFLGFFRLREWMTHD